MSSKPIHFFDIDSILSGPGRSWSSSTLKIRMVLNYKKIPYKQSFISYPDIAPLLRSLSVTPHRTGRMPYTLPAIISYESSNSNTDANTETGTAMMDSLPIARHLDALFPSPPLFPFGRTSYALALATENIILRGAARAALPILLPQAVNVLDARGLEYFTRTRAAWFGKPLSEMAVTDETEKRRAIDALKTELEIFITLLAGAPTDSHSDRSSDSSSDKKGPFLEGQAPGYADFILVTFLSWSHKVDKDIWREIMDMGAGGEFRALWDACLPWMQGQGEEVDPPAFQA